MYLQRRNGHYWFRKATPLDLLQVLGQAEIRCSLRTTRRDLAKRRAGQLQVALENVFAVLRSERPLGPTKMLMAELARDALENGTSSMEINPLAWRLQKAVDALGSASWPPPAEGPQTPVAIGDIDALLQRERPRAEANRIATELLGLALRIRRGNNWVRSEPAKMLVSLCERLASLSEQEPLDTPNDLAAIRAIIREEVCRAGLGVPMAPASPVDAASLREIVATEVRAGVASAGRDRWSTEPLSKMIEKFLEAQYPSQEGKSKVGTKHRADVERRLAAFLAFSPPDRCSSMTREIVSQVRFLIVSLHIGRGPMPSQGNATLGQALSSFGGVQPRRRWPLIALPLPPSEGRRGSRPSVLLVRRVH
jgi:hypothetical protein